MKTIDDTIKELYPPKDEQIEPDIALFNNGYCYYKDPEQGEPFWRSRSEWPPAYHRGPFAKMANNAKGPS